LQPDAGALEGIEGSLGERPWTFVVEVLIDDTTGYRIGGRITPWSITPPVRASLPVFGFGTGIPPFPEVIDPLSLDFDSYGGTLRDYLAALQDGEWNTAAEFSVQDQGDLNEILWGESYVRDFVDAAAPILGNNWPSGTRLRSAKGQIGSSCFL
jgi:hypothetical protein